MRGCCYFLDGDSERGGGGQTARLGRVGGPRDGPAVPRTLASVATARSWVGIFSHCARVGASGGAESGSRREFSDKQRRVWAICIFFRNSGFTEPMAVKIDGLFHTPGASSVPRASCFTQLLSCSRERASFCQQLSGRVHRGPQASAVTPEDPTHVCLSEDAAGSRWRPGAGV